MKFSKILDILSPSVPDIVARRKSWQIKIRYIKVKLFKLSKENEQVPRFVIFGDYYPYENCLFAPTQEEIFADDWEIVRLKK